VGEEWIAPLTIIGDIRVLNVAITLNNTPEPQRNEIIWWMMRGTFRHLSFIYIPHVSASHLRLLYHLFYFSLSSHLVETHTTRSQDKSGKHHIPRHEVQLHHLSTLAPLHTFPLFTNITLAAMSTYPLTPSIEKDQADMLASPTIKSADSHSPPSSPQVQHADKQATTGE
jgi:hypothetical protein